MAKLTLKVKKIAFKHPQTKKAGFVARVVTNGTESFDDICEIAGMNTTYAQEEIVACAGLMLKAAARQLKNGKIIDLGPLGKLYPSVSGKWVEKEDDLALSDLTPHTNYRPSQEIAEAIKRHLATEKVVAASSPHWRANFLNSLKRLSDSLQLCGESLIFATSKS